MEPHTAQSQPSGSHSSRSAEEDRNYEKYERRKGFISLLEHKYAQQPDDEGRKCFLNALVEYANAHLPSSCSCSFSIGEDYNVEEYTGVFILILGCMFAQQPDGERRKSFLTTLLERISPQQPSSRRAFEEECNDEGRKGLLTTLQEHIGETVPSTTWALLWLADIEKLEDWVNLTKSTAEQRISDFTRLALTNIGVGYNIISSCTYGARP